MPRQEMLTNFAAIVALLMLADCAAAPTPVSEAAAAPANCGLTELAELPVEISPDGDAFVPVRINGVQTKMALSTEANPTLLFEDSARRLGLRIMDETLMRRCSPSYGGYTEPSADEGRAHLQSLQIGPLNFKNFDILVLLNANNSNGFKYSYRYVMEGTAGVLPSYFISNFDVEFDLAHHKIRLFSPNHCPGQVQYWPGPLLEAHFDHGGSSEADGVGPQIRVHITVNGHAGTGIFESSGDAFAMNWSVAALYGIDRTTPGVTLSNELRYSGNRKVATFNYVLSTLSIGDETLKNVPVMIWDTYGSGRSMSIGEKFFADNRAYISYKEQMIYFTPYNFSYAPSEVK